MNEQPLQNIGALVEGELDKAGIKVETSYRLVMLDIPGIEPGDLTVDCTMNSRLFPKDRFRNIMAAIGPVADSNHETSSGGDIKEAVKNNVIQPARLSLKSFVVNLDKGWLKIGRVQPNPEVCLECTHCRRTFHTSWLKVQTNPRKFFCKRCHQEAMDLWKSLTAAERKHRRKPNKRDFRLDRERNVVEYVPARLKDRHVDELTTAARIPPDSGGVIQLPRPIVMLEPGACKLDWQPDADDKLGLELKKRCQSIQRGSVKGQTPIPLDMVLDEYAPDNHDRHPWARTNQMKVKVPGIIGVHLLVDSRMAGWVPVENLRPDVSMGWWREFPEYDSGEKKMPAREV